MDPPFEITAEAVGFLAEIERLLGRFEGLQQPRPTPILRRSLRIRTVQGSVAIEGNALTEDQITAVLVNGGPKVRRGAAQKCGTRVQEYPALQRESRVSFNLWSDAA